MIFSIHAIPCHGNPGQKLSKKDENASLSQLNLTRKKESEYQSLPKAVKTGSPESSPERDPQQYQEVDDNTKNIKLKLLNA